MAIQESDITVALSPELDDAISHQVDACEKKLLMGTVLHNQLKCPLPSPVSRRMN